MLTDTSFLRQIQDIFEPVGEETGERKQVGAVVAATRIIEALCAAGEPLRMTVIARKLNIAPSSCFNILRTLAADGILTFDPRRKTYAIGLGLVSIARAYLTPGGSLRVIGPLLEEFAHRHEVTLVVWRRSGHHMVVVTYFDHSAPVRVHIERGTRFPLLAGAMGRIMATQSGLSQRELRRAFARVKWDDRLTFEELMADAEVVRERGWAFDDGTFSAGISTLSAPIATGGQRADAVLSATMVIEQHDPDRIAVIAEELCALARLLAEVRVGSSF